VLAEKQRLQEQQQQPQGGPVKPAELTIAEEAEDPGEDEGG
jgi:hypothetical protein